MKQLEIVKNGRSPYHIVGSYFADECERYAASELQKYIYEATGTLVPYYSDICTSRSVEILVGYTARNAGDYVSADEVAMLGDEGYLLQSFADGTVVICGKCSRGTLYGVYAFLARYLGFRAFTSKVEKIDHVDQLVIPPFHECRVPDFEYRDAYFRDAFDGAFAAKRMLNTSRPLIVIPAAFLGGTVFCLVSDLIARTLFSPMELNISTVTSIFGAPVVIAMLLKRRGGR